MQSLREFIACEPLLALALDNNVRPEPADDGPSCLPCVGRKRRAHCPSGARPNAALTDVLYRYSSVFPCRHGRSVSISSLPDQPGNFPSHRRTRVSRHGESLGASKAWGIGSEKRRSGQEKGYFGHTCFSVDQGLGGDSLRCRSDGNSTYPGLARSTVSGCGDRWSLDDAAVAGRRSAPGCTRGLCGIQRPHNPARCRPSVQPGAEYADDPATRYDILINRI